MMLRKAMLGGGGSGLTLRSSGYDGYCLGATMDSTGDKIVLAYAVAGFTQLRRSTDYGLTWSTLNSISASWQAVASSANGVTLLAVPTDDNLGTNNAYIYTSADSGATWTARTGPGKQIWYGAAISADGTKMVAVAIAPDSAFGTTYIYTSTDSGVSWTARGPAGHWESAAISDNGVTMLSTNGTLIYLSTNSGASFAQTGPSGRQFRAVACSGDGTKMIAGGDSTGGVWFSLNSGVTWTQASGAAGSAACISCDISDDGTKMFAGSNGNVGFYSVNSGASWSPFVGGPTSLWALACNGDGTKLVASSAYSGPPYVLL